MKIDSTKAKEIIEKIPYITLATVDEKGMPWNAPVFAAYDDDFNFYWGSHVESQHSKNIDDNGNVYIVIYDSTAGPGEGEGVYIRAKAYEIKDQSEIITVHELLKKRHIVQYWRPHEVKGGGLVRLYKAIPQKVWLNDEDKSSGTYIDIRKQVA